MMRTHPTPLSFERKGKRFFIQSLEKFGDLSTLLAEIEFVFRNQQTREVVLYFQQRFRVFPNIITPLASAIDHIRASGRNVRINATFDELEQSRYIQPQTVIPDQTPTSDLAGKVWCYSSSQELHDLVVATIDYLSYRLEWERGTLLSLEWSLYELLDNVFQHSLAKRGFFMFEVQQQRRRLSYCVADQGRGIYQSLLNSDHKPATPTDAITLAVRKGVTRDPTSNMGNGLWGTSEIIARGKGQMTISSGGAALYFNTSTATAKTIEKVRVVDRNSPGTYIDAQIDASVEVHVEDMFDPVSAPVNLRIESLEDESSGTLRVHVKDFKFGAGTRETGQLARNYTFNILNQSESPLVIDFSGIGIVSSSFADEFIAKLYKNLGPEQFGARVRLHGLSDTNRIIIQNILAHRLSLSDA